MKSVMFVDDEQIVRTALKKLIDWRTHGYEVFYEANNGEDALNILRNECIDLLFLDIKMQGMSGIDVIQTMYEENITYPSVYVITSYDDFGFVRDAFRLGVKDFIIKNEISRKMLETIAEKENPPAASNGPTNQKIKLALRYIDERLNDKITLQGVADELLLSPSHFSKLFAKEMQISFNKYVTQRRIEYACRLLKETQDYVYQIAELAGFSSLVYFTKVFKNVVGVTPNDYRNGITAEGETPPSNKSNGG